MMFTNLLNYLAAVPDSCRSGNFLGLVPWYQYLEVTKRGTNKCAIDFELLGRNSDIPLVLLAVIDNLLRVAGLAAVIFVIYGGVLYATSQGSPEQTSKAQSTIINSVAGLAVAIIAVVVVSFIGRQLR